MAISSQASDRKNLPGEEWSAITPSDTATLSPTPRAIMVNVAGNVAMTDIKGNSFTFTLAASTIYPLRPSIVSSTGTTATGIVGIY